MRRHFVWVLMLALSVLAVGCGQDDAEKSAVDAVTEAAAEVGGEIQEAAEAASESVDGMIDEASDAVAATVDEIKAQIAEKEGELQAVKDQIASMSPTDMAGDAGAELKAKSEALMGELAALRDKLTASDGE